MTYENSLKLIENKKPFELIQEIENYQIKKSPLSLAARGKVISKNGSNYLSDNKEGYGPCRNTLCGCSCSSDTCVCSGGDASIYRNDRLDPTLKAGNFTAAGRESSWKDVSGDVSFSVVRGHEEGIGDVKFLSGSAGLTVGQDQTHSVRLGVNLIEHKANGVHTKVGVNADTGVSTENGLEAKFLGFGVSVGKKNGISTPLFSITKDSDDCVIQ